MATPNPVETQGWVLFSHGNTNLDLDHFQGTRVSFSNSESPSAMFCSVLLYGGDKAPWRAGGGKCCAYDSTYSILYTPGTRVDQGGHNRTLVVKIKKKESRRKAGLSWATLEINSWSLLLSYCPSYFFLPFLFSSFLFFLFSSFPVFLFSSFPKKL